MNCEAEVAIRNISSHRKIDLSESETKKKEKKAPKSEIEQENYQVSFSEKAVSKFKGGGSVCKVHAFLSDGLREILYKLIVIYDQYFL